jgi:hypothetical protein
LHVYLDSINLAVPWLATAFLVPGHHHVRAHRCAAALCVAVTLLGCQQRPATTPPRSWRTAVTPDSALTFAVPATYRERSAGCWGRFDGLVPGPADFCLTLVGPENAEALGRAWNVACRGPESTAGDAVCYQALRVDTATFDGRPVVIRRALLSGTIGHYRRLPAVLVHIPLGPADVAVLQGEHREPGTYHELVAIARTVRPLRGARD